MVLGMLDQDKSSSHQKNSNGTIEGAYPLGDKPVVFIDPNFYHLTVDGVDSVSGGGESAPFRTLEFAKAQMSANDGLYIHEGTHLASQDISVNLSIQIEGHPLAPTMPVIDCQNIYEGFRMTAPNVTLRGFNVDRFRGNGGVIFGDVNGGLAERVLATRGRALAGGNLGGFVLSNSPNDLCENVTIRDCRANDIYCEDAQGETGVSQSNASGIYSYGAENCNVEGFTGSNTGNTIFWKRATGLTANVCDRILGFNVNNGYRLSVAGNGDPIHYQQVLQRFIFYSVTNNNLYLEVPDTININDTLEVSNGVVDGGAFGALLQNFQNLNMYSVIFQNQTQYAVAHRDSMVMSANDVNENIYVGGGNFVYNQYAGNQQNNLDFDAWKTASGQDGQSQIADPLFVDAANRNYQLSGSSPYLANDRNGKNFGAYREGNETIGATV